MSKENLVKRILIFVTGLFIMAFGVALSVKANLGVSPISCTPYVYSLAFPLSMGTTTIIFNILIILLQIVVLGKKYQPIQLLQFPVVILFGFFTDFTLYLVRGIELTNYLAQLILCLASCAVLAFGVFLEVKAKVTYLAGEGLSLAISEKFKVEFGKAKIGVDSAMVVTGVVSSFIFLSSLQGVREGTIIAAVLVGFMARIYSRKFHFLDNLISSEVVDASVAEKENIVITISRQYGSGGHEIGQLVARKLGYSFYDKELIAMTAERSGFTQEYINKHEQKLENNLLYSLYSQNYAYVNEEIPPLDALFLVQTKIIREISDREPCVIVGRCSNFILKDNSHSFNVFIHADKDFREKRILQEYNIDENQVVAELENVDRERANYCKKYTGKQWNDVDNYDLTLDSSMLGIEKTAEYIAEAVREHFNG